ncbi:DUF5598 domain-containing protein [Candidatus Woesearchaeota archaeon]|nr:DUF5598 domain-containing protein [Candidatus Woesearchaeota archaeon]
MITTLIKMEVTTMTAQQQNIEDFVKGRLPIPKCMDGDAYTVAGEALASDAMKEQTVYGMMFRTSPQDAPVMKGIALDDRIVLFGLTDYIRNHLTKPITMEDIDRTEAFMSTAHAFGGALPFDRTPWERVVIEYGGYLPIKIEALPEGSTFYPNEVPVQVTSLGDGFGEVAALIEAHMVGMVSNASVRVTLERHMLDRLKEYTREDNPDGTDAEILFAAQLMIHDFGMRASSASEESEVLGKAHLLVFPGTDTFNAAYQAWVQNGDRRVGSSVLALAHRTVQGHPTQKNAFHRMRAAAGSGGIGSYVADCYDFHTAVTNDLVPLALESSKTDKAIIVGRPDSGDYLENTLFMVTSAKESGLYRTQANGRYAMTTLSSIKGDSMNWTKITTVLNTLRDNNYSPVNCGIFGVGGWLRNAVNRDTLSVAYKLMAKGHDSEPVVKLADTKAKMSVPGPVYVLRSQAAHEPSVVMYNETGFAGTNTLQTFYDGAAQGNDKFKSPCLELFSTVQSRVLDGFDASPKFQCVLSDAIVGIQEATLAKYGRSMSDYKF